MIKRFLKKDIHRIYINIFFRSLAFSLFGIFIPIYFLNLGFPLKSIWIYFLIFQISTFLSFFLSYSFAKKSGYKVVLITSVLLTILFLIMLQTLSSIKFLFYIISIVGGIENGFYALPLHLFFTKSSKENKRGTQLSNLAAFGNIAGVISPLIGAIIAYKFGFNYLLIIVLVIIILSIFPLVNLKNFKPNLKLKFSKIRTLTQNHKGFFIGNIFENMKSEVEAYIWPIFIFLSLKDLISIGWLRAFITLGTIIFTLFLGRFYDKKSKYLSLRIGAVLYALVWILRILIHSSIFIFISTILAGIFGLMIALPFTAIFYDKTAKQKDQNTFVIFTEIPTFIGRAIIWILAILLINKFETMFILAAISCLVFLFLKFGIKEHKKLK